MLLHWYVTKQIDGKSVLVPQVYLASASRGRITQQAALVEGDSVTIIADDTIDNSGVIRSRTGKPVLQIWRSKSPG
ncbi:hypothetical protein [Rhodospirillum sp. A1_3_36]|uniref:hypothetical protein n=1 Tax=Rhodospirillum sp. A1_3_36 TaxID=3391666 RepID=UPI0039A45FA3